jgi:hypothetical protein
MCGKAIRDVVRVPGVWKPYHIPTKVKLRISDPFHGVEFQEVINDSLGLFRKTHNIVNILCYIFVTTKFGTSKPKFRISAGGAETNVAELGGK